IPAEEIEKHHYRDRDKYASLMVRDTENGVEMSGMVDGVTRIEPVYTAPRSLDGYLPHRLHRMTEQDLERIKNIATPVKTVNPSPIKPRAVQLNARWTKAQQELFIISDSEHHKGMGRLQLCAYVVIFITAVNMRFAQTTYPTIHFRVVQILMSTQSEEEQFLQMYSEYVEPAETIEKMYTFSRAYENNYPDLFLVLSGRDLATVKNGRISQSIAGMAQVGGACSTFSNFAISEDRGQAYLGIFYATHELGHSYGCVHDGDPRADHIPGHKGSRDPDCAHSIGYTMSNIEGSALGYYFSRCCLEQMRLHLSNQPDTCFRNTYQHDLMKVFPNFLPARVMPVSVYCQAKYPYLDNVHNERDLKEEMNCRVVCTGYEKDTKTKRSFLVLALDGMICD
ncbi:unnamed protein product, partial [Ixodes hexagonus]